MGWGCSGAFLHFLCDHMLPCSHACMHGPVQVNSRNDATFLLGTVHKVRLLLVLILLVVIPVILLLLLVAVALLLFLMPLDRTAFLPADTAHSGPRTPLFGHSSSQVKGMECDYVQLADDFTPVDYEPGYGIVSFRPFIYWGSSLLAGLVPLVSSQPTMLALHVSCNGFLTPVEAERAACC